MKILQVLAIIVMIAIAIMFASALGAFILIVIGLMLFAWICGVPVTITENGNKKVYRWTKRIR